MEEIGVEIKARIELRKRLRMKEFENIKRDIIKKDYVETDSAVLGALIDDFEYDISSQQIKYEELLEEGNDDKNYRKTIYKIKDSGGLDVSLVNVYLEKGSSKINRYCGIWIGVQPELLTKTQNIEEWKEKLSEHLDHILDGISLHIPCISEFKSHFIRSTIYTKFLDMQKASNYFAVISKSFRNGKYDVIANYPEGENDLSELQKSNYGFKLVTGTHTFGVECKDCEVNFSITIGYYKLYSTSNFGVKRFGNLLESIQEYTVHMMMQHFSNVFGNTSYYTIEGIKTRINGSDILKGKKKRSKLLGLVEEINEIGNLNEGLASYAEKHSYNAAYNLLRIMLFKLKINPLAIPDNFGIDTMPGPVDLIDKIINNANHNELFLR